jgi:hypothetical protein
MENMAGLTLMVKFGKIENTFICKTLTNAKKKGAVVATFPCGGQPKINGVRCNVSLEDAELK